MRQWPGNGADLDFRGVIKGCTALLVAAPVVEGKISEQLMNLGELAAFLESEEGAAAKKVLFGFRLWCVVELHAALHFGCLLYTSPSPRDQRGSRMPSSA